MATTLRHEDGRLGIFTGNQAVGARKRGWSDTAADTPDPPSPGDLKSVWVDYAESRGIDTDGMTKDEIRDALEGA